MCPITRPRVLVVGPLPPPVGGVETMTTAVLGSGAFSSFDVVHCDLTKGRPKDTQGQFDFGNMRWAVIHFWRMFRCIVSFRPAVVYMPLTGTWSGFWRDGVLALIARCGGAKVVGHVHGGGFERILTPRDSLVARSVRTLLQRFHVLLMLGTKWRDLIEGYGYTGNVVVVPPTVNPQFVAAARALRRDYGKADPVGLFVGHVGIRKGVLDLLDALALLKRRGRSAKLVIVGPPQRQGDWEAINRRHAELELQGLVQFSGPLEREALYERFREADYLILPSYIEGLPIVFLEAGAFGLPVIGTPVGSVPDLLTHDRNALLVKPGDVEAIAANIDRLRVSREDRERLGTQLKIDVARFGPDAVCGRIATIIRAQLSPGCSLRDV